MVFDVLWHLWAPQDPTLVHGVVHGLGYVLVTLQPSDVLDLFKTPLKLQPAQVTAIVTHNEAKVLHQVLLELVQQPLVCFWVLVLLKCCGSKGVGAGGVVL